MRYVLAAPSDSLIVVAFMAAVAVRQRSGLAVLTATPSDSAVALAARLIAALVADVKSPFERAQAVLYRPKAEGRNTLRFAS